MGLYDTIYVYGTCPYCKEHDRFDAQTNDLDMCMHTYEALPADWYSDKWQRKMRVTLPVFKQYPLDKSARVWKNQAERTEAEATVSKDYFNRKWIDVTLSCLSKKCRAFAVKRDIKRQGIFSGFGRIFDAKIRIKDGKLIGEFFDIVKIK